MMSAEDIAYTNSACRADQEQNDKNCRPEMAQSVDDLDSYDIVYLGYPIWWEEAPRIIDTFLESYDFSGKTLAAFCTSASSGSGDSDPALRGSASGATWLDGQRFSASASEEDVLAWANKIGIK